MPFSAISFLAEGASSTSLPDAAGAGDASALAAGADEAAPEAPPITASFAVASTVVPSVAMISDNTPAAGLGTSTLTLSVSSSHSISSCATVSPTFLNHVDTVASVTLSPNVGTMTSTACAASPASALDAASAFGASVSPDGLASPALICANKASTPTVSPSGATISDNVPAAGLGTSTVTLSVSSSHSISSTATASPGFLNQVATVASVTDSPSVGTRTSVIISFL
jgi:hypothetical protein